MPIDDEYYGVFDQVSKFFHCFHIKCFLSESATLVDCQVFNSKKKANQKLTCILAFSVLGMQARDVYCFVSSLLHLIVSIGSDSAQFVSTTLITIK